VDEIRNRSWCAQPACQDDYRCTSSDIRNIAPCLLYSFFLLRRLLYDY
jgi:hypothetical protein